MSSSEVFRFLVIEDANHEGGGGRSVGEKKRTILCLCAVDTVFLDISSSFPLLSRKGAEEEKWTSNSTNKNCPI
eukprot:7159999-Ditylum_brightwellii.AAC.1